MKYLIIASITILATLTGGAAVSMVGFELAASGPIWGIMALVVYKMLGEDDD